MSSTAIIIGINDYAIRPLTSAVNDAIEFRALLLKLGLVAEADIQLFTSPVVRGATPATSQEIVDALYDLYVGGVGIERFFFYYAGHGLLAYTDAARTSYHTALMPSDVTDLKKHGRLLIDFNDLLDRMSTAGPQEQLYFVDACRDLPYELHPDVGRLGWAAAPPGPARAQAALFAVSPLGTALGQQEGLGVITGHVLEAMKGKGVALEYDSVRDVFTITMQSVHAYAEDAVREALKGEPAYRLKYQLPELVPRGPACQPIRVLQQVEPKPLTVHIDPDAAAGATKVSISLGRLPLTEFGFPPRTNHETVRLPPNRYLLTAESQYGLAQPARGVVDVRKVSEATIHVGPRAPSVPPIPDNGPLPSLVVTSGLTATESTKLFRGSRRSATKPPSPGRIRAFADEPQVTIEIEQSSPPYQRWAGALHLDVPVPSGAYRVRFRLGPDVFSEVEIVVEEGRETEVRPTAALSPLLQEALGVGDTRPEVEGVSESIGPMQAGILETTLAIVGIKPFDLAGEMFSRFGDLVALRSPKEFDERPLSIVVAVDGNGWPESPFKVLRGIHCRIATRLTDLGEADIRALQPLQDRQLRYVQPSAVEGQGFDRVGTLLMAAPANSFFVRIESPYIGAIELAAAALPRRATVLVVLLRPDGSIRLSQNILRFPGVYYPGELVPYHIPFGKVLRQLQVGQLLFQSGELISRGIPKEVSADINQAQQAAFLEEMLFAKWTDPVLSCMAYYAWERAVEGGSEAAGIMYQHMQETGYNLRRFFGDLSDSQIVYARINRHEEERILNDLLDADTVPILAASALLLGRYAEKHGRTDVAVAEFARRIPSTQIWSVSFRYPTSQLEPFDEHSRHLSAQGAAAFLA